MNHVNQLGVKEMVKRDGVALQVQVQEHEQAQQWIAPGSTGDVDDSSIISDSVDEPNASSGGPQNLLHQQKK